MEHWHRVAVDTVEAELVHRVEEGKELVEFTLLDWIVLVVVTAGASHRHCHPDRRDCLDSVHHVFGVVFRRDRAAFVIDHVVPIEAGGNFLLLGRVRKQVACELFDSELIEGLVLIECLNHPVPPLPHVASSVDMEAVGVGVAR